MRSIVVTGVSRGLGAALFSRLAADPENRLLGLGRRFTSGQRAAAAGEPDRIRLYEIDLAGALPGLRAPLDAAIRATEPPVEYAVIILNAGMVEPVGAVGTLPDADVARSVAVNLTAPMLVAGAFVAALPPGTPATIVNVSSGAADRPIEGWAAYCAAKAGGEMFFRVLAAERPDLRVVSVNPGRMDTGMQAVLRESDFPSRQSYVDAHEQGGLADPADVAARIISQYVTG